MDYHTNNAYSLLKNFDDNRLKNVDRFLKSLYQYYTTKGLGAVILTQLCAVLSLGFTIGFSLFLIAFIDWSALSQCHDDTSCSQAKLIVNPFRDSSNLFCFLTIVYFLLFGTFWLWRCVTAYTAVIDSIEMARFYREQLELEEHHLLDVQWYQVLERLIILHNRGERIVPSTTLTVHEVAMRIMRKDNYLIGLINKNCLDLSVPWWMSSFISGKLFLTKSLEWSLSFCILEYMFDDQEPFDRPEISNDFLSDVNGLKWRFQVVGLIHFMLLPFMLAFMAVHFFLQNAQQFHTNKAYLGPREWSPLALWQFREFNELPHIFEERMNKSYAPANEYISCFHNPYLSIVARFVGYVSGAFIATLLLISFVSEGVLLYVQYGEHNLLWYLGIFSAVFAAARSFIPDETKSILTPPELLHKVSAHTHYCPDHWIERETTLEVKEEISDLFQFKAKIFLMELLSVVLTPAVLCFSLPSSAPQIVEFVRFHSRFVNGVGAVCDFSLFDFEQYGDEKYGAETVPTEQQQQPDQNQSQQQQQQSQQSGIGGITSQQNSIQHQQSVMRAERPLDGKLEKSFLNFKNAHPNFEAPPGGKSVLNRLNAYKELNYQHRDDMLSSVVGRSMYTSTVQFQGGAGGGGNQIRRPIIPSAGGGGFGINSVINEHQTDSKDSGDTDLHRSVSESSDVIPNSPIVSSDRHLNTTISGENIARMDSRDSTEPHDEINPFANPPSSMAPIASFPINSLSIVSPGGLTHSAVSGVGSADNAGSGDGGAGGVQIGAGIDTSAFPTRRHRVQTSNRTTDASPPRIEMSILNSNRSRSLFPENAGYSNYSGSVGSRFYNNQSNGELPSVLLSVLRQEHIDYENDFYWMTRFHHDKLHNPQELAQSLAYHSQMQSTNQENAPFSPVIGMHDIYAANSGMFAASGSNVFGDARSLPSQQQQQHHPQYQDQQAHQQNQHLGAHSPPRYPYHYGTSSNYSSGGGGGGGGGLGGSSHYHIANPFAYSHNPYSSQGGGGGAQSPVYVRQPMQMSAGYGGNPSGISSSSSSTGSGSLGSGGITPYSTGGGYGSSGGGYRHHTIGIPGKTRRTSSAPGLSKLNENDEVEEV